MVNCQDIRWKIKFRDANAQEAETGNVKEAYLYSLSEHHHFELSSELPVLSVGASRNDQIN